MDDRWVVRIFLVEDHYLWQEFVVKSVDPRGHSHKPHIRKKQLETALLHRSLFGKSSWWALAITLGVLTGLLLFKFMQ